MVVVSESLDRIVTSNVSSGTISIIEQVSPPASGFGPPPGSNLVVLDAATRKEVKQINLGGGAAGIVMVPDRSRAYVAVSGKDKVAVLDLKSLEVTGYVSTGKQPDGLAWVR